MVSVSLFVDKTVYVFAFITYSAFLLDSVSLMSLVTTLMVI